MLYTPFFFDFPLFPFMKPHRLHCIIKYLTNFLNSIFIVVNLTFKTFFLIVKNKYKERGKNLNWLNENQVGILFNKIGFSSFTFFLFCKICVIICPYAILNYLSIKLQFLVFHFIIHWHYLWINFSSLSLIAFIMHVWNHN